MLPFDDEGRRNTGENGTCYDRAQAMGDSGNIQKRSVAASKWKLY